METERTILIKKNVLKYERYLGKYSLSNQLLQNLNIFEDPYTELSTQQTVLFIEENILTDKIIQVTKVPIPKNWLQHLKKDLFPNFLLKIFPVKYKNIEVEFRRRYLYPFLEVPNSNHFIHDEVIFNEKTQ